MIFSITFIYLSIGVIMPSVLADAGEEEVNPEFLAIFMQCMAKYPVSDGEFEKMKNKNMPESENAKCLLACTFKKTGLMDENGKLSVEGSLEATKRYIGDDPDTLKRSEEFTRACESVNVMPVTDGNRGCERAAHIYNCSAEKAPQFGLV